MYNYKENFVDYLKKNEVKFIDHDERVVELRFSLAASMSSPECIIKIFIFYISPFSKMTRK